MMKGQRGYVVWARRPLAGLFQRVCRWYAMHGERQVLAQMSDDSLSLIHI